MRRAPSATSSSSVAERSASGVSSTATLSIGVTFPAGVPPPASFVLVNEEGTPRLQSGGASTGFGYNSGGCRGSLSQQESRCRSGIRLLSPKTGPTGLWLAAQGDLRRRG